MTSLKYFFFLAFIFLSFNNSNSQSWIQQASGTNLNLNSICFIDANTGFIGADSGKVLKTINGGVNWVIINSGFNFNIISIKFFNSTEGVAAGDKVLKTTNGGTSWFVLCDTAFATDVCYLNNDTWYVSGILPHTNKMTSNQGAAWQNIPGSDVLQMSIFFIDQNTGWISGQAPAVGSFVSQHVDRTSNRGTNWSNQYSGILFGGNGWFYDLYFTNNLTGFGVLTQSGGLIMINTTNGGNNWTIGYTPTTQKNIFFINATIGWTCGFLGVIQKTMNTGNTWVFEQIVTNTTLNSIFFVTNELGWTCGTGGVILKSTNGGITALNQNGTEIPDDYFLSQNYPNPFNPSTQIDFNIPKSSFVKLAVFDAIGREVAVLVNEELSPSSYKYDWNAINFPSGIYFYKITAGEFTETRKMVLLK